jgi:uncharacterized membrane protein YgdD (TMEM256/DUF423 family)
MALAVVCGAFGAHALRDHVTPQDMAIWEKAVLYHLVHALAVLVIVAGGERMVLPQTASKIAVLLLCSISIFSGSLYLLVLLQQRWLGAVTPLGGSGFIIAWLWFAVSALRSRPR